MMKPLKAEKKSTLINDESPPIKGKSEMKQKNEKKNTIPIKKVLDESSHSAVRILNKYSTKFVSKSEKKQQLKMEDSAVIENYHGNILLPETALGDK